MKYTPEGGAIQVEARPAGDDWVEIVVRDNGVGITGDLFPRLFELFAQDTRTLDHAEGGLGIGLALVRRLTELHGGTLTCESEGRGRGATFTVRLPRSGRREELRGSRTTPVHARIPPLPMLVVDDNRDAAETLAPLLELDGHRVRIALDGEHALAEASLLAPQVVMLDLALPKLDGLTVARRLRADPRLGEAVIVATSGHAQAADRVSAIGAGFDAHLAKPVELEALYRVIEAKRR